MKKKEPTLPPYAPFWRDTLALDAIAREAVGVWVAEYIARSIAGERSAKRGLQ